MVTEPGNRAGPLGGWAEDTAERSLPGLGACPRGAQAPGRRRLWPAWADPGWRALCTWRPLAGAGRTRLRHAHRGHRPLLSRPPRLGAPLGQRLEGRGSHKGRGSAQRRSTVAGRLHWTEGCLRLGAKAAQFLSERRSHRSWSLRISTKQTNHTSLHSLPGAETPAPLFFLATPCGMRDLSSWTEDQSCVPCTGNAES